MVKSGRTEFEKYFSVHCLRRILASVAEKNSNRYWRWVLHCTAGELVGFVGVPVLGGALALWLTTGLETSNRSLVLYAVAVTGGLGEGAVLAMFQFRVLNECIANVDKFRWVLGTSAAAAFAWACGMLASTLDDIVGISTRVQVMIWIPASILILASIGTAQAWALRQVVDNPRSWIVANCLGWLAGLPWTFVLPALVPDNAPTTWWIAAFAIAAVLMGTTVGLVTGFFLLRLRPTQASAGYPEST